MSPHGMRKALVLAILLAAVPGCLGVPRMASPGPPTNGVSSHQPADDPYEGRLFRNLAGGGSSQAPITEVSADLTLPPAVGNYVVEDDAAKRAARPAGFLGGFFAGQSSGAQHASVQTAADGASVPADDSALGQQDEDEGFQWSDLKPTEIYKDIKEATGFGPDEELARSLFSEGEELYRQERYKEAADKFKSAAGRWPDSTLEEDALFYLGECQFFSDQYTKANDTFGKLLKKYDYTRRLDVVSKRFFAIGRYWEQYDEADPNLPLTPNFTDSGRPWFDTFGHGIKAFDTVRLHDPTGPLADDAVMASATAYFRKERFEEAAYNYDLVRNEYPKSEHQVNAHLLGMKSRELMYQGPFYDSEPLEEAGKIAGQALAQFPAQLGEERQSVIETRNRVMAEKALREWNMAQYYDRKKYYGSARIYYQSIIKDYPQTELAEKAGQRLEEIKDLPDIPPNHFKWLTDTFDKWE